MERSQLLGKGLEWSGVCYSWAGFGYQVVYASKADMLCLLTSLTYYLIRPAVRLQNRFVLTVEKQFNTTNLLSISKQYVKANTTQSGRVRKEVNCHATDSTWRMGSLGLKLLVRVSASNLQSICRTALEKAPACYFQILFPISNLDEDDNDDVLACIFNLIIWSLDVNNITPSGKTQCTERNLSERESWEQSFNLLLCQERWDFYFCFFTTEPLTSIHITKCLMQSMPSFYQPLSYQTKILSLKPQSELETSCLGTEQS